MATIFIKNNLFPNLVANSSQTKTITLLLFVVLLLPNITKGHPALKILVVTHSYAFDPFLQMADFFWTQGMQKCLGTFLKYDNVF